MYRKNVSIPKYFLNFLHTKYINIIFAKKIIKHHIIFSKSFQIYFFAITTINYF